MPISKIDASSLGGTALSSSITTASGLSLGITMYDMWRLSNDLTGNHEPIATNLERVDTATQSFIGSAMTQSSGIFTFPSTGIYYIQFHADIVDATEQAYVSGAITTTTDNSTYNTIAVAQQHLKLINDSNTYCNSVSQCIFDVTNTTTHKVRFAIGCQNNDINLNGNTGRNDTNAIFIRLADT